ncbi:uncharacterized protein LOC122063557 isoform X2 [Macadamia integrifolia]|uniref:uncharacterized protein LOC122063557 isoform X2 n=1 Tax=Macadamia integrifolia TaxID=60698 RepID=UPI001C4E834B|nr:uncharacterized protein LOC122063557 isoform X2 [Macadamia integrifolia]
MKGLVERFFEVMEMADDRKENGLGGKFLCFFSLFNKKLTNMKRKKEKRITENQNCSMLNSCAKSKCHPSHSPCVSFSSSLPLQVFLDSLLAMLISTMGIKKT